jgi:hypothetical protein
MGLLVKYFLCVANFGLLDQSRTMVLVLAPGVVGRFKVLY